MGAVKEVNQKARLVGINHVALEVGSIEEALSFYGQLFELSLRGRSDQDSLHRAWRSVYQDGSSHVANVVETTIRPTKLPNTRTSIAVAAMCKEKRLLTFVVFPT